ncbi:MAG: hypothetical protein HRT42_10180 [Campylobacteraceae bacterium]|nr:hypothetical protein [Campylobacteraceae bacterium]
MKLNSDNISYKLLEDLGYSVSKIKESKDFRGKMPDFKISYDKETAIVEAKIKIDNDTDISSKESQLQKSNTYEIDFTTGYKNNLSRIIKKSSKQLESFKSDEFKFLSLLATGMHTLAKFEMFEDTLYGCTSFIVQGKEIKCYFFNYSEFKKYNNIDGAILSYIDYDDSIKSIFYLNTYSKKYKLLKNSNILKPFGEYIFDPLDQEHKNYIFLYDGNNDNDKVQYIKNKYNIKGFIINIDSWNTPEIATVLHYTNITQ